MAMWLILSAATDRPALWACQGLRARGLEPLEWVSLEMLAGVQRWEHRLGAEGVDIEITLANGRCICTAALRGVLNRLVSVPDEMWRPAHPQDRDYVIQELTAFFLSWLSALPPPVLNRPTPQGLCGAWRHPSEWVWLAAQAGLPTPPYRQTSRDLEVEQHWQGHLFPPDTPVQTVFVVAGQTVGPPAPAPILHGCRRLAELADTELLGIELVVGPTGAWTFASASPWPDLHRGGDALLDTLAAVLAHPQGTSR